MTEALGTPSRGSDRGARNARDPRGALRAGRARVLAAGAVVAMAATLVACAPEPIAAWGPPTAEPVPGVTLVAHKHPGEQPGDSGNSSESTEQRVDEPGGETAAEGQREVGSGDPRAGDLASDLTGDLAAQPARLMLDDRALGLLPGRLLNESISLAARFVYVPGVPEFNARVNEELRRAIDATGDSYTPQAHATGAGLDDRGCVPGSSSWPAPEVLARAETGPPGASGTAVICELVGAFGDLIEVRLRVVTGTPELIDEDRTSVLFADVTTGRLAEVVDEWNEKAPDELWHSAVELLRREAGALSTAALAEPAQPQLDIAAAALETAAHLDDGGLLVTVPAGLASPELAGLGIERTDAPTLLRVEPTTALSWSNEQYRDLRDQLDADFVGVTASANTVSIDCALIPCVALTYDDGPGEHTPRLLNTLQAEQARATFFMLGGRAANHPDTVSRAAAEGHELGSHTMSHPDLTTLPLPEAKAQVLDAAAELRRLSGEPVTTFRPPYGAINDEIIEEVGLPAVLWSIDTNDWRLPGKPALIERSAGEAKPGSIILFHDIHADTVDVAGDVIRALRDRGFETVTVSQLFGGQVPEGRVSAR